MRMEGRDVEEGWKCFRRGKNDGDRGKIMC